MVACLYSRCMSREASSRATRGNIRVTHVFRNHIIPAPMGSLLLRHAPVTDRWEAFLSLAARSGLGTRAAIECESRRRKKRLGHRPDAFDYIFHILN
eukprot:scaffold102146_cov35-Tisochrysis_lutea.AAC.2